MDHLGYFFFEKLITQPGLVFYDLGEVIMHLQGKFSKLATKMDMLKFFTYKEPPYLQLDHLLMCKRLLKLTLAHFQKIPDLE